MSSLSKRELFLAFMIVKCSQPADGATKLEFELTERTTKKLDRMITERGWDADYSKFVELLNP